MKTTRRDFLKTTTAAGAAAVAAPYVLTSGALANSANAKPSVAAIGVGGPRGRYNRGRAVGRQAMALGRGIACCDVDALHAQDYNKAIGGGKLNEYTDYRKMLEKEKPDVVTIGTPDHWHVPIAIAALKSGADVYCEKPLTLTINEGKQICKVVKETGRVFQVGTQQRSENDKKFLMAIALVQAGYIGENVNADVAIGGAPAAGPFKQTKAPDGLDWDFWVGPAQSAPYMVERRKQFRWFLEYSGGKMTDWGAHHIDIAQWALGMDKSGPVEVSGKGNFPPTVPDKFDFNAYFEGRETLPNAFNAATKFNIDLKFGSGSVISVNDRFVSKDGKTKFDNGILFTGSKGRIFVNRSKLQGKAVDNLTKDDKQKLQEVVGKLYKGKPLQGHMKNFFGSLEDRSDPISDVYSHHRTMTSCHLCNITLMLGRSLKWDPKKEGFIGDEQASALMARPSRSKYL